MNKEHSFSFLVMLCKHASSCAASEFSGVTGGDNKAKWSSNAQPDKSSIKPIASATGRQWGPDPGASSAPEWLLSRNATLSSLMSPTPRPTEIIAWQQLLMHTLFAHLFPR